MPEHAVKKSRNKPPLLVCEPRQHKQNWTPATVSEPTVVQHPFGQHRFGQHLSTNH
jgi:hypothetical protein